MSELVIRFVQAAQNSTTGRGPLLSGMCCKHAAAYDVEAGRYHLRVVTSTGAGEDNGIAKM
jgi:hypothetical protein